MSQASDHYISLREAFFSAEKNADDLIEKLRMFAAPLMDDWRQCYVDLAGHHRAASDVPSQQRVDGSDVPDPAKIEKAIALYRSHSSEVRRAWSTLSEAERKALVPPDGSTRRKR
jgi:hypothetical protein